MKRPTAAELMDHPWILDFRAALLSYEEAEVTSPPERLPLEEDFEAASVARQAAILREQEVEAIKSRTPDLTPTSDVSAASSENSH
jgi:mitogen-activated protein kinase kinase kinase